MNTSFERGIHTKDEWLTPPELIKALGEFDLDPCAPVNRPWSTAKNHFTIEDDGLKQQWYGRVWLNPPYGKKMHLWLKKMSMHKNGIVLTFNRGETKQFFDYIWDTADAILFIRKRIVFYHVTGRKASNGGGCGSVLIAYGKENAEILRNSPIGGKFIQLKQINH